MATGKQYSVWLINPRRARWQWLFTLATLIATPLTSMTLGFWMDYFFGRASGMVGTVAGLCIVLFSSQRFSKWFRESAIASVGLDNLLVFVQQTGEKETFLFSELEKYRVLDSYRGNASLRLIAKSGRRLTIVGVASPEFTALIKEFDMSILQYERLSGKRFTRIDMG